MKNFNPTKEKQKIVYILKVKTGFDKRKPNRRDKV